MFVNNGHYKKFEGSNSKTKNNLKTVHSHKDNITGNNIEKTVPITDTKKNILIMSYLTFQTI